MNGNKNTAYQHLWDINKEPLKGKFRGLYVFIRKKGKVINQKS